MATEELDLFEPPALLGSSEVTAAPAPPATFHTSASSFIGELTAFRAFGTETQVGTHGVEGESVPVFLNEFWTAKQRAAHSLHEISYRACFKPQLPRFFIERLTQPGQLIYDPFLGRGTTAIEAALLGRRVAGCDVNPLSPMLCAPRLRPPSIGAIEQALAEVDWNTPGELRSDLDVFYHPDTLREVCALRTHLLARAAAGPLSAADAWVRMVATNRLTGHSAGFFSVYSLPPNQAVTVERQRKINTDRNQTPPRRVVPDLIRRKSASLLSEMTAPDRDHLELAAESPQFLTQSCDDTPQLVSGSVALVVTSPPFLDIVDYATDNWLRCWFNGIDAKKIGIWTSRSADEWSERMTGVFRELARVLIPGGHVAFEVGEVRRGKLKMEDLVIPAARAAGLEPVLILINSQVFTKTSNCWGVTNQVSGTNTNRVVLLRKP